MKSKAFEQMFKVSVGVKDVFFLLPLMIFGQLTLLSLKGIVWRRRIGLCSRFSDVLLKMAAETIKEKTNQDPVEEFKKQEKAAKDKADLAEKMRHSRFRNEKASGR